MAQNGHRSGILHAEDEVATRLAKSGRDQILRLVMKRESNWKVVDCDSQLEPMEGLEWVSDDE